MFLTVHDIVGYQVSDWYHNTMNNNWVMLTLCKILSPPHQKTKMSLEVTSLRIRLVQESDFLISFCNFRYSLRNCRNFACESISVVWRRSRERVTKARWNWQRVITGSRIPPDPPATKASVCNPQHVTYFIPVR